MQCLFKWFITFQMQLILQFQLNDLVSIPLTNISSKQCRAIPHDHSLLYSPSFSLIHTYAHIPKHDECQHNKKIVVSICDCKYIIYITVPQIRQHKDLIVYGISINHCFLDSKSKIQGGRPIGRYYNLGQHGFREYKMKEE